MLWVIHPIVEASSLNLATLVTTPTLVTVYWARVHMVGSHTLFLEVSAQGPQLKNHICPLWSRSHDSSLVLFAFGSVPLAVLSFWGQWLLEQIVEGIEVLKVGFGPIISKNCAKLKKDILSEIILYPLDKFHSQISDNKPTTTNFVDKFWLKLRKGKEQMFSSFRTFQYNHPPFSFHQIKWLCFIFLHKRQQKRWIFLFFFSPNYLWHATCLSTIFHRLCS